MPSAADGEEGMGGDACSTPVADALEESALGNVADCSSPVADALGAALDADGEEGKGGDLAGCSSPETNALEDALDADGEDGPRGEVDDCSAPDADDREDERGAAATGLHAGCGGGDDESAVRLITGHKDLLHHTRTRS